jgi:GTPase SAR1 family protein
MLGDERVGKTSVMTKYALGYFNANQPPTKAMSFYCKK